MKRTVVIRLAALALLALLVGGTPALAAQKAAQGQRNAANRVEAIAKELELTADQKKKLEPILKAEMEKVRALQQDNSLSQEDKRAKLKAIREESAPKIKAILTADQLKKYEGMRGNRAQGADGAQKKKQKSGE